MPENNDKPETTGPTRRQVATAAAWSVPVIALAVGAPAAAATEPPIINFQMGGASATGVAGEVLTGDDRPGASIRTKVTNTPVEGQVISFTYSSPQDEAIFTLGSPREVATGSDGFAYVDATISASATPDLIGYVLASWTDTSVTPNAFYTATVAIKIVAPPAP